MSGVNKVILLGNLGKDPEVKYLEGGVAVARFPLATSETFKDKSGVKREQTEWHNVVLWRGLAELSEKYLKKGDTVYLEGKIRSRSFDDKDGVKRYSIDIVAENLTMLSKRKEEGTSNTVSPATESSNKNSSIDNASDDLPF